MVPILPILLIGGAVVAAAVAFSGSDSKGGPSPLAKLAVTLIRMARKEYVSGFDRSEAISLANSADLPLTARAINAESALPTTEMWPGTKTNVRAYILGLVGPLAAPPVPPDKVQQTAAELAKKIAELKAKADKGDAKARDTISTLTDLYNRLKK
jgi:hypothetical protein